MTDKETAQIYQYTTPLILKSMIYYKNARQINWDLMANTTQKHTVLLKTAETAPATGNKVKRQTK